MQRWEMNPGYPDRISTEHSSYQSCAVNPTDLVVQEQGQELGKASSKVGLHRSQDVLRAPVHSSSIRSMDGCPLVSISHFSIVCKLLKLHPVFIPCTSPLP